MGTGRTLDLKALAKKFKDRVQPEWEQKERDRSLSGKARRKARKEARRLGT